MPIFTYRNARSPSLTAAIVAIFVVETTVLHLLLIRHHPLIAWSLTVMSVATVMWIIADYRSFGRGAIMLDEAALHLEVGRRITGIIPRERIVSAVVPTWRDLPTTRGEYLNGMKPATPNVLLTFSEPVPVRLLNVATRSVRQLGLHLDDSAGFLGALTSPVDDQWQSIEKQ